MSTKALCKYLMHFTVLNLQQQKLQQVFLFFPPTLSLSLKVQPLHHISADQVVQQLP